MGKRLGDSVLTQDEINKIRLAFITEMKSSLDFISEPIIDNAIWTFLDTTEANIIKINSASKKIRSDISWKLIKHEFGIDKKMLSKKLNKFIVDKFKRETILRDIGNAHSLLKLGFHKESVIISGGVIEEILRLYILDKGITLGRTFNDYINCCYNNNLMKSGINSLSSFLREFRNLVHLEREVSKNDTIKFSIAKSALSSIFAIIEDINK